MDELLLDRIEKLEKDVDVLKAKGSDNTERLIKIETKQDFIIQSNEKLEKAIQVLTDKPNKLQDHVKTAGITALVVWFVTYIVNNFFGK